MKKDIVSSGKNKDLSGLYPTAYEPKEVEKKWYEYWEKNGFFCVDEQSNSGKQDFCIVLPPPNVTGNLHIGHTLTVTIQDCISRWHRMKGENVIWIPGFDHGGIATQTIVEKKLMKEKKITKQELGREQFLNEITQWKTLTQSNIEAQLKMLGASLDFQKTLFTLDENSSKGVMRTFITLFEKDLIYRKEKLVNWSGQIQSVISDIEVDHLEIPEKKKVRIPGLKDPVELGLMDYFYYSIVDSDEKILIATTRLETMLGDAAVAVNPNDRRFAHLIGKFVSHPYTGENLPIISDETVSREIGTGAMKVTPAHDLKDFEIGMKHGLKMCDILNDDGTINVDIENFKGKHRLIVRNMLRKSLSEKGLYKEAKNHSMTIPFCSRSGDIVEFRLKDQWYVDCNQMGQNALEAVKSKRLQFIPDHHEKVWFEWFRNLKDWCISRQLWWGHQIPAYKILHKVEKMDKDLWVAASSEKEAVEKASKKYDLNPNSITAIQDLDVLDTWFSSALYPLTALGWPSKEENLKRYYPLNLMETGFDILFFWVARMVMLGEHITGKLPFAQVLLHGMVCDSHGRKMTKSLGNTIDPLDVIEGVSLETLLQRVKDCQDTLTPEEIKLMLNANKQNFPNGIPECGTDGLRFSLLTHDIQNQRINVDVKSIRICRHFCNKIWQGVRLFTKAIENSPRESLTPLSSEEVLKLNEKDISRWILSRLAGLVAVSNMHFEAYEFHLTTAAVRQFWVQNFCDVYIEYVKSVLSESEEKRLFVCRVMLTCIETFLKVISPMMPFISEELYHRLYYMSNIEFHPSISIAAYPTADKFSGWRNTLLEADVLTMTDLIGVTRSLKSKHGVSQMRPTVVVAVEEENTLSALSPFSHLLALLAKLDSVTFHLTQGQEFFEQYPQDSWVFETCDHGITIIMDIKEKPKPQENDINKLSKIRMELNKLNKMLSDRGYRKSAPLSMQEKTMARKASLEAELQKLSNYGKKEPEKIKEDSSVS
ncbi:valine--tRNA ligase, mitochondrial [Trichonephila inaurata madagascariensis]|uniref:valine--tRNA ligase n=1 Tax=Trichonephila inaurata madagascariensis TaxID=2747483 RepID=A0A8X7CM67_9ARAC|nr:valine--tRNA ligase, mitochondrial [Trichonephila inaurata madagascariensis]